MTYAEVLISRYRTKGVLIDTNLLLLLLVGNSNVDIIEGRRFKRTEQYSLDDYGLLKTILDHFQLCFTTPHILTEVSNLAGQLSGDHKAGCYGAFARTFSQFDERSPNSLLCAVRPEFIRFGLTDSVIGSLAEDCLIITDDFRLAYELENTGKDVLNFNHIRFLGA